VFSRINPGAGGFVVSLNSLLCAALALSASPAGAEEAKPVEATASASAEVAAPVEASASADPVAAPAPAPESVPVPLAPVEAPKPAEAEKPLFIFYGILKPEIIVGTSGVETFGKATAVAATAAAHPIADPNYDQPFTTFQLQQTRVGVKIGEGKPLSGKVEIDFIDDNFSHSSPIQGTGVRLRLAYVTYKPSPGHTVMFGQNWDIFSPLNAATMNMVGNSFQAGNVAFLRPQLAYTYGTGEGIEISAALGLRQQNVNPAMNLTELGMFPTFAIQAGFKKGKDWYGVSGIIGAEETSQAIDPVTRAASRSYKPTFAGNVFANLALGKVFSLGVEGYIGQNTNALGMLSLGSAAATTVDPVTGAQVVHNVVDAGGYLSAKAQFNKVHGLWVTVGGAGVLNPAELAPGYTAAVAGPPVVPAARSGIGGIESNVKLGATYTLSPMDGLQFYVEPSLFLTRFRLAAADDPTGALASRNAFGVQLGTKYTF
jgi:hypothetical protein